MGSEMCIRDSINAVGDNINAVEDNINTVEDNINTVALFLNQCCPVFLTNLTLFISICISVVSVGGTAVFLMCFCAVMTLVTPWERGDTQRDGFLYAGIKCWL